MKRSIIVLSGILFSLLAITSCSSEVTEETESTTNEAGIMASEEVVAVEESPEEVVGSTPQIEFDTMRVNFGTIKQGEKFEHDFHFSNTGDAPLMITNARGSCGCTVPEYPREPIAPGASGVIHVVFNSSGKSGTQHKTVTLQTNASTQGVVLHVDGFVEK